MVELFLEYEEILNHFIKDIDVHNFICPLTRAPLVEREGFLVSTAGTSYEIRNGIPQLFCQTALTPGEIACKRQYDEYYTEEFYDNTMQWLFESFYENENIVREKMIAGLELKPNSKVLEIGCGTGCDSHRIAKHLGGDGELYLQDLSSNMVEITRARLTRDRERLGLTCNTEYLVSSARNLPFPDRFFDSVYHFGGFNNFDDQKCTLAEFSRITKIGGKIVVGDESVPPWLEKTEFGEIVCTNNPLFRSKVPLNTLPECARDVSVKWTLGNCFYVIEFRVGEGPPPLNLDLPHQGRRGGTMRTRYFGQLEGVSPATKALVDEAAQKTGESLHEWIERSVRRAALQDLE